MNTSNQSATLPAAEHHSRAFLDKRALAIAGDTPQLQAAASIVRQVVGC